MSIAVTPLSTTARICLSQLKNLSPGKHICKHEECVNGWRNDIEGSVLASGLIPGTIYGSMSPTKSDA